MDLSSDEVRTKIIDHIDTVRKLQRDIPTQETAIAALTRLGVPSDITEHEIRALYQSGRIGIQNGRLSVMDTSTSRGVVNGGG